MSGGVWEYTTGNYNKTVKSSGLTTDYFTTYSKYFDVYTGTTGKTGDATTETSGWYGDYANFVTSYGPWFVRGGGYVYGAIAGQFYYHADGGDAISISGSRLVLA